jgi:membrane-associated phospholipid phosphatase
MKARKNKETQNKILLFLLVVFLNSVCYKAAQLLRPEGFLVTTWIDNLIPYISYFVIPYASYVIIALIPFFLYWRDYKAYRTMALSMATVLAIAVVIYLTFQTSVIRPNVDSTDIFNQWVAFVYSIDKPLNALPSLHVALPTLATLFIYLRNRKLGAYLAPLTFLIILSTMFIKQHSVFDVAAGLILAFSVFRYRRIFDRM